ncbi:MAG: hypothetical protein ACM3L6_04770 [Deltaproteobacteria bacterium]
MRRLLPVAALFLAATAAAGQEVRPALIEKIEAATGIPVTQAQREAIAAAAHTLLRAMGQRQRQFIAALKERGTIPAAAEEALTPTDGLPFDFDQDALAVIAQSAEEPPDQPAGDALIDQGERDTIRFLDAARRRDIARLRRDYARALSGITDLPASSLTDMLTPPAVAARQGGAPKAAGRNNP